MRKFIKTAGMSVKESGYYGVMNIVGHYLTRYLRLFALCLLWRSLYGGGIEGDVMTLAQTLGYTVLSAAFNPLLDPRTQMPSLLHEGKMNSFFLCPAGVFSQITARVAGGWLMYGLVFTLPCLLLVAPAMGITLKPVSWLALPSLVLCISQGFAVDYLFGCLVIHLKNLYWQAEGIRGSLSALLTGALIPFSLLPRTVADWFAYSPLGTLAGAPLSIAVGLHEPFSLLLAQLCWNAVLWPLAILCFSRCKERMISYGG